MNISTGRICASVLCIMIMIKAVQCMGVPYNLQAYVTSKPIPVKMFVRCLVHFLAFYLFRHVYLILRETDGQILRSSQLSERQVSVFNPYNNNLTKRTILGFFRVDDLRRGNRHARLQVPSDPKFGRLR